MAGPSREAIDTFVAITGASEAVALQELEEYRGDLNQAVNAYLNEQESAESRSTSPFQQVHDRYNDSYGPLHFDYEVPPYRQPPGMRWPEPFSFIRQSLQSIFGGDGFIGSRRNEPGISHPRNVREIQIEFKDEGNLLGVPRIEDVTGRVAEYHPTIQGNVTYDDVEDNPDSAVAVNERASDGYDLDYPEPSAPRIDFLTDKETEDDMMKAAIEASKREAAFCQSEHKTNLEDLQFEQAISLSLKVAKENARHVKGMERTEIESSTSNEADAEHFEEQDQLRRQYLGRLGYPTFAYDGGHSGANPSSSKTHGDHYFGIGDDSLQEKMEIELPSEPSLDVDNSIALLVKMPDGSRHGRRFLKSDKFQCLVDFIDIGEFTQHRSYKLVRQFPRRVFGEAELDMTFDELGLTEKQEALFLELA